MHGQPPKVFHDGSRRFGLIVLIGLALLVIAGFFAKPAWRALRERRALKYVAQAQAAMAADDFDASAASLRGALALSARHPDVLRAAAEHFSRLNRSEGLEYWQRLDSLNALTHADRLAFARLALDQRSPELARKVVLELGKTHARDPDVLRLLAELLLLGGEAEQARLTIIDALAHSPWRADLVIVSSRLQLASGTPPAVAEARAQLFSLVIGNAEHRTEAALTLLKDGRLGLAGRHFLRRLMNLSGDSSPEARLVDLIIDVREPDAQVGELAHKFAADLALQPQSGQFMLLLKHLLALEEFSTVAALLSDDLAESRQELWSFRLEALTGLRDGPSLDRFLQRLSERPPRGQRAIYEAIAAHLNGRTNDAQAHWRNALAANTGDHPTMQIIAERAETLGATNTAVRAWELLLLQPDWTVPAAWPLIRLTGESTDPRPALEAYRRLSLLRPENPDFRLRLAFYRLLLRVDEAEAQAVISAGPGAYADRGFFSVTAALAALRREEPDRGVSALEAAAIQWDKAPRTWRVIQAAALMRAGQTSRARIAVKAVDLDQVGMAELELLGELATNHEP